MILLTSLIKLAKLATSKACKGVNLPSLILFSLRFRSFLYKIKLLYYINTIIMNIKVYRTTYSPNSIVNASNSSCTLVIATLSKYA